MKLWKIILICMPISLAIVGIMAGIGVGMNKRSRKEKTTEVIPTSQDIPTVVKYEVKVINNSHFTVSGMGTYEEGESVTLTATNYVPGYFLTWTINSEIVEVGSSYSLTVGKENINIVLDEISYNYLYYRTENNIYYGTYPQTLVENQNIINELNLCNPFDENKWISFKYYTLGNVEDYMYYIDVDINDDGFFDFRGVYFTKYRSYDAKNQSATKDGSVSYQDDRGYYIENAYWFSYDPIKWDVLKEENGKALITTHLGIDVMDFYKDNTKNEIEHNGGVGYVNNYELSNIRNWLNDNFYNTAFNDLQKDIIDLTNVDNLENEKVFLLSKEELLEIYDKDNTDSIDSELLKIKTSDYADANNAYLYNDYAKYFLRSYSGDNNSYIDYVHSNGSISTQIVTKTDTTIRPALWINLKNYYKKVTVTNSNEAKGRLNISGEFDAPIGYTVNLIATPSEGHEFVGWFIDDEAVSTDINYKFNVIDDIVIDAKWIVLNYTINVVNKSDYDFEFDHGGCYEYGREIILEFNPLEGYRAELYDENNQLLILDDNKFTLNIPSHNLEYSLYFKLNEYKIIYDIPFGIVNPNPKTHTIEDDEINLLSPETESTEFSFNGWYINDELVDKIPGHIASNINVYGDFTSEKHNVVIINNTNSLEILGAGEYDYNDLVKVAIKDNNGSKAMVIELETLNSNNKKAIRMFTKEVYEFYMPTHDVTLTIMDMDNPNYSYGDSPEENRNFAGDDILYFGTYPQGLVKDRTIKASLIELAGKDPIETGATGWVDYGFYEQDKVKSYMWYKDIILDGEKYRAVYFTEYRPGHLDWKHSQAEADPNRVFEKGETYFFKFEPIAWKKSKHDNSNIYAALLCLDAQHFDTDHADYTSSSLRNYLRSTFYETAFNETQRKMLQNVYVTGDLKDKVCIYADHMEVSDDLGGTKYLKSEVTDYALCLRPKSVGLSYEVEGRGTYFLSDNFNSTYHVEIIHDAITDEYFGSSNKKTVLCIRPYIKLSVTKSYGVFLKTNDTLGGTATGGGVYNANSHVILTATPNDGYEFIGWVNNLNGGIISRDTTYEIDNIEKNYSITAKFLKKYYITYENVEGADNHLNPGFYTTEYEYFSFFQPSKNGYDFEGWSINGEFVQQFNTSIETDIIVKANWKPTTYTITYDVPNSTDNPNPKSYTIEDGVIILNGEGVITNPNYSFVKWVDENEEPITSIDASETRDRTIKGIFTPIEFELIVHNLTNGLELSTNGGMYKYGSEVVISLVTDSDAVLYFEVTLENDKVYTKVGTSIKFNMPGCVVSAFITRMADNSYREEYTTERGILGDAYFGSYPQSLETDETIKNALLEIVGKKPTEDGSENWVNYGFYEDRSAQEFMWYKDITLENETKYRAVYFTNHRPANVFDLFSNDMISDYNTNTIYFFKFEPVKWMHYFNLIIGSTTYKMYTTYNVLDEYQFFTSDEISTDYVKRLNNEIISSDLRNYVIGDFYNLLFENSNTDILGPAFEYDYRLIDNISIFRNSSDIRYTYLTDTDHMKASPTDYAECLRPLKNGTTKADEGGGSYWLRIYPDQYSSNEIINDASTGNLYSVISTNSIEGIRPIIVVQSAVYTVTTSKNKTDGGTITDTYSYFKDTFATVTATPATGYEFKGWELNGAIVSTEATYNFKVTENVNLKALFGKKYSIIYSNTKDAENLNQTTYTDLDSFDLMALPNVYGYEFAGWTLNGEPISRIENMEEDIELVAKWNKAKFNVTLTPNISGLVISGAGEHEYESTVNLEVTTSIAGYDIIFMNGDNVLGTNSCSFVLEGNVTITLVKSPIIYDINYELYGGTKGDNPENYTIETPTFTLNDASKPGYTFAGWYTSTYFDENDKITEIVSGTTGVINLYAKFDPNTYKIYYPNCIDGVTHHNDEKYKTGDTVVLWDADKDLYEFDGWTLDTEDSTDYIHKIEAGTYGDLYLYAHFTPREYNINYNLGPNGYNDPDNPKIFTCESDSLTLKPATKYGYTFIGWYDNSSLQGDPITVIPAKSCTGNLSLYPSFEAHEYIVTMNNSLDGVTIDGLKTQYKYDDNIALSVNNDNNNFDNNYLGYKVVFSIGTYVLGDSLKGSRGISVYINEDLLDDANIDGNVIDITVTLEKIIYIIEYENCEDAINPNETELTIDDLPYVLSDATKDDYEFLYWKLYVNQIEEITKSTSGISNTSNSITLYANWGFKIIIANNTGLSDEELAITGPRKAPGGQPVLLTSGYSLPAGKTLRWHKVGYDNYEDNIEFDFMMEYGTVTIEVFLVDITNSD